MRKIIRMIFYGILSLIALLILTGILFINLSPQFGSSPNSGQRVKFSKLNNYHDNKFVNQTPSPMNINYIKLFREFFKHAPNRNPVKNIDVQKIETSSLHDTNKTKIFWFGHSTFLLILDGKKILIDPMLGNSPSPVPFFGVNRYSSDIPLSVEEFPYLDLVIITHDHYDHLDYGTIRSLKDKVGKFFAPLGVGNHLKLWGVDEEKITELNWWESIERDGIKLSCTPARHFSGRGLFDRAATLWCSWVIEGTNEKFFFCGDSGYDVHFKEIGEKFGPFDISFVECGQYNIDWKLLHMMPEETVLAGKDLNSAVVMPIHWGAFTLAFHDWTNPIERAIKKADELNVRISTPRIGEPIIIGNSDFPKDKWWVEFTKAQ